MRKGFWSYKITMDITASDREWLEITTRSAGAPEEKLAGFLDSLAARMEAYRRQLRYGEVRPSEIREDLEGLRDALVHVLKGLPFLAEEAVAVLSQEVQQRTPESPWEFFPRWEGEIVEILLPAVEATVQEYSNLKGGGRRKPARDDLVMGIALDYAQILRLDPQPNREGPLDSVVAVVLEILGEPLEDRFALIQKAIAKADALLGKEWRNPPR